MIYTGYENLTDAELVKKAELATSDTERWHALSIELAKRLTELQQEYNLKCSMWVASV